MTALQSLSIELKKWEHARDFCLSSGVVATTHRYRYQLIQKKIGQIRTAIDLLKTRGR